VVILTNRLNIFFLYETSVEQVETVDGKVDCVCLGWLMREESGREEQAAEPLVDMSSYEETYVDDPRDHRFTTILRAL
jgi:hypothetical protein